MLIPWILAAQPPVSPDSPLVAGVVLERDSAAAGGEFSIRAADNQVFRYAFNAKTYVERDELLIDIPCLRPGEKVEVLSERTSDFPLRYARTVHVIQEAPRAPRRVSAYRQHNLYQDDDPLFARGDMALAGVIQQLNPGQLVLRSKDGDHTILLRQDTRYLENGAIVDAAALSLNMRVFVRAGRNIYNEIEGFQVVWGKILAPQ